MKLSTAALYLPAMTATVLAAPSSVEATSMTGGIDGIDGQRRRLPVEDTGPFCVEFNNPPDREGFDRCPGLRDNVDVNPSPSNTAGDDPINPLTGDTYLHLVDRSGASLACGTGTAYTGNWTAAFLDGSSCGFNFCYDVNVFYDGCLTQVDQTCTSVLNGSPYADIFPSILIGGGAPNFLRASFRLYDPIHDQKGPNSGWKRICAPIGPLNGTGNLPSNEYGYWQMAKPFNTLGGGPDLSPSTPRSQDSEWSKLLDDITYITLPIDFYPNPAERVGYDNLCIEQGDCECVDTYGDCTTNEECCSGLTCMQFNPSWIGGDGRCLPDPCICAHCLAQYSTCDPNLDEDKCCDGYKCTIVDESGQGRCVEETTECEV